VGAACGRPAVRRAAMQGKYTRRVPPPPRPPRVFLSLSARRSSISFSSSLLRARLTLSYARVVETSSLPVTMILLFFIRLHFCGLYSEISALSYIKTHVTTCRYKSVPFTPDVFLSHAERRTHRTHHAAVCRIIPHYTAYVNIRLHDSRERATSRDTAWNRNASGCERTLKPLSTVSTASCVLIHA